MKLFDYCLVFCLSLFVSSSIFYLFNDCIQFEILEVKGNIKQYSIVEDPIKKC